ncbi:VWA domain-containing protein [Moraxella osloensis]|jgi:stress response protein SCP2|nr:VWA domain-containing protein [Moraxella osloensis]MDK1670697.1 VWA domain-containing protein [Moraxella osloensis]
MQLIRGQKLKLSDVLNPQQNFSLEVETLAGLTLDIALFGLNHQAKLSDEAYMIFYNQPQSPCSSIKLTQNSSNQVYFDVNLRTLPNSIEKLVLTITIDGNQVMSQLPLTPIKINQQSITVASFIIDGSMFQQEKAIMVLELYKKDAIWRMSAVGQGFNGGLAALIQYFGGEVANELPVTIPQITPTATQPSKIDLKKKLSIQKAEKTGNASIIDLTKKSLVQLEKKNLLDLQARVALVLDASGSMNWQYKNGDVQQVVNRLMPLAISFDNDGSFECWAFAQYTTRLDDVNLDNVTDFINQTRRGWKNWLVGSRINEEIPAIEAVINYYQQFNDGIPVYVLFISDGGVGSGRQMQKLLTEAAKLPIFWQFVGIGGHNYGVLEKLDDMTGRIVDNCNFFDLDSLNSISDDHIYELLLEEFPMWLTEAKEKQVIR